VQNVATLRDDPASILHLYRTLLALRKATPELRVGDLEVLDGPDGVLAYRRTVAAAATAPVTVAINFSGEPIETGLAGELLVSSIDTARGAFSGTLAADEAVVLR
jgi:glycosidase